MKSQAVVALLRFLVVAGVMIFAAEYITRRAGSIGRWLILAMTWLAVVVLMVWMVGFD